MKAGDVIPMTRGWTKPVLDHGYVKLIDFMGSDEDVIADARMSTNGGFISWEAYTKCEKCGLAFPAQTRAFPVFASTLTFGPYGEEALNSFDRCHLTATHQHEWKDFPRGDEGLLETMMRERHSTPFETAGEVKIEVFAPIMVFREWHRHRTQAYNEFSARYAQMPNVHYVPGRERVQLQSKSNKQGSAGEAESHLVDTFLARIEDEQGRIYESYEDFVEKGLAKEIARLNTPVSRYSKMRAKTDLFNWLKFLGLRLPKTAQWEIRQFAGATSGIISALFPRVYALFENWELNGARLSGVELGVLRAALASLKGEGMSPTHREEVSKLMKRLGWEEGITA